MAITLDKKQQQYMRDIIYQVSLGGLEIYYGVEEVEAKAIYLDLKKLVKKHDLELEVEKRKPHEEGK